jgi:putative colanic acid biosynthesis acetyltransferase WcaF
MKLDSYDVGDFTRGRSAWVESLWLLSQETLLTSWFPGSTFRVWLLRLFGAQIGRGVVIKSRVRVKFPWRLVVGDFSWIGEDVWIDNLAEVTIGSHSVLSQGVYLCTGSHDWTKKNFNLIVKPISIGSHAWLCAMSSVGPGVVVGEGAVLGLSSTATHSLLEWSINHGNPARWIKARSIQD